MFLKGKLDAVKRIIITPVAHGQVGGFVIRGNFQILPNVFQVRRKMRQREGRHSNETMPISYKYTSTQEVPRKPRLSVKRDQRL